MSFREILTAAVADFAEHGYDSQERVEYWTLRLRIAAEQELGAVGKLDAQSRVQFEAIFKRLVDNGAVLKNIPGVPKYTLAMVRPQLRAELDRRILAATDLIKLHRAEAVEKTIQRFSGWATSIPKGGDATVDKVDVKRLTGKALKQLRYEQRRVAIDQGKKLISNVQEIVALDNGAIGGFWDSVHRAGYDNRPEHLKRDGRFFLVRDSWAVKDGLIKLNGGQYTDEIEKPGQFVFCSCSYIWVTSPARVPAENLTEKGKLWLKQNGARAA